MKEDEYVYILQEDGLVNNDVYGVYTTEYSAEQAMANRKAELIDKAIADIEKNYSWDIQKFRLNTVN